MKRVSIAVSVVAVMGLSAGVWAHEGHKHATTSTTAKPAASTAKPASPAAATVEKVQLTGEIIDPQCWFTHNGEGPDHVDCAISCAEGGQDLAFLDRQSGHVYAILAVAHGKNPNEGLYEHVGVPVTVRGTAFRRGANRGLIVQAVEKKK